MSKAKPRTGNYGGGASLERPYDYMNPGHLREINLSRLTSGLPYQRTVSEKKVDALVRNWNNYLMEPIVVSYRDGKYYVIDGQHRVTALCRMYKDTDAAIPCVVHTGLTYADEAALFYSLDQCKSKLTSAQSINALLQSGANAEINDIQNMLQAQGLQWSLDSSTAGDYKIKATRSVIFAYRLLGRNAFSRMLILLSETWHGDPASLSAMMLSGMALFLKTYETQINDHSFITRFSAIAPEEIIKKARTDLSTSRNDLRCARSLLVKYNKAVRRGKKLNSNILC